jgi:homoserine kinase type II
VAVFTSISAAQARAFLKHFRIGELVELRGIPAGIENTNYFLTTTQGRWVLTVFERLTPTQLPFYLGLMRHLAARDLPVPSPQLSDEGRLHATLAGKPAAIVTRLGGHEVSAPTPAQCALVGSMLARMHLAAADYPVFQPNLRGIGWWKSTAPLLERFLTQESFELLVEEVVHQDSFTRSAAFEALPQGPVHADLFRDNVLLEQAGTREEHIGGVIDFYFAGCTAWLYDLAVTINDWCIHAQTGLFDEPRAAALLDAYHAARPLTELEHQHCRTALRAAALRFWISRLYDLHLPRRAELLTPKDPVHFERVLIARRTARTLPWPA